MKYKLYENAIFNLHVKLYVNDNHMVSVKAAEDMFADEVNKLTVFICVPYYSSFKQ